MDIALADLSVLDLAVIATSAFVAGTCSGMTGFGGGLLLPPILATIIGVQHVVPVLSFSMLMTNAHRLWLYRQHADLKLIGIMLVTLIPTVLIGASIYLALPTAAISIVLGSFLLLSIPVGRLLA